MIDLYYWTTPNGHKIVIFFEEAGVPYRIIPVNISEGEQFDPEFLKISPNNRIPAIVDRTPRDGGAPLSLFESGAILLYLAEKFRCFLPHAPRHRYTAIQWLMWQVAGLGPMLGQNHHFSAYAPRQIPYAIDRYVRETARLYSVLDRQLQQHEFIAENYSVADMAAYPWIVLHETQRQDLDNFPSVKRWFEALKARPAIKRAYEKAKTINDAPTVTEKGKSILFGQGALTLANAYAGARGRERI